MKKKSFLVTDLQIISHCATILRSCPGISFSQANKVNHCKIIADASLKEYQAKLDLIRERLNSGKDNGVSDEESQAAADLDFNELITTPIELEMPFLYQKDFEDIEISGDKEVPQNDGTTKKFNYREAFFELLDLIIL